jgi:hypothetical protein
MKNNQLLALGAAVVLLAGYLMMSSDRDVQVNQLGDTLVTLTDASAEQAATLVVTKDKVELISLKKVGDQWLLASGHPADTSKVAALIIDLSQLQAESRRVNMDQLATYGLGKDDAKTSVVASDASGKALASVVLGKKGPQWGSAWTQREGKSEVLLLQEGPVGRLVDGEFKAKDWLNRQPAKSDNTSVSMLTLTGELSASITRKEAAADAGPAAWVDAKGNAVESAKAEGLLSALSNLYIDDVASDTQATPVLELRVQTGGKERAVILGQNPEKSWRLLVGDLAYNVSESSAKSLRNRARELVGADKLD